MGRERLRCHTDGVEQLRNIPGGMLIAFVIGVADAVIVWAVAVVLGVEIMLPDRPGSEVLTDITIVPILITVGVACVAAGVLLWILQRLFPERALQIFQITTLIVLIVSLANPLLLDQPVGATLALVAMHLLVGTAIIAVFTWVGGPAPRRAP